MLRKKATYTNITAIPSFIPRQLAIDILHSHGEIIELNPLVLRHEACKAPRDAPSDEFYATWYEITQRIQFIPGIGKLGSGEIKFKGCFHDMPWGLQTHIYAPANLDLRNKWQICGNQPDEPPQTAELGIGAPPEGLYLREDIEIKCNVAMVGFVKKETKAASKVLVERLVKKAELLDSGALSAIMDNGKLKTVNPADRSVDRSPDIPRPQSSRSMSKGPYNLPSMRSPRMSHQHMAEQEHQHVSPGQNNNVMELPGDYYHAQSPPQQPLHPNDQRYSSASESYGVSPNPSNGRWSHNSYQSSAASRPTSYSSDGPRSPGVNQKGFAAELPATQETREEHEDAKRHRDSVRQPAEQKYRYDSEDFANTQQYSQPAPNAPYNPSGR